MDFRLALLPLLGLGGWAAWCVAVLQPASRTARPWGPRWLANFVSSLLHGFGCWWLRYTHNVPEVMEKGVFGPGKQYIVVWHPHGSFTVVATYFLSHWWAKNYPGGGLKFVCVAPLLMKIPLLAEYLLMCNAKSSDRKTFTALLESGASVAVQPGGLAEQVATDHQVERLFFPKNLGFIRLALKQGVPLLPLYAFGENQLYKTNDFTRRVNGFMYKNFGIGSVVVVGAGGIPNSPLIPNPGLLPGFQAGLHVRFGEPVDLGPKEENPTDARVGEAFELYTKALRKVFDEHKDKCLPSDVAARGLEIIVRGSAGVSQKKVD